MVERPSKDKSEQVPPDLDTIAAEALHAIDPMRAMEGPMTIQRKAELVSIAAESLPRLIAYARALEQKVSDLQTYAEQITVEKDATTGLLLAAEQKVRELEAKYDDAYNCASGTDECKTEADGFTFCVCHYEAEMERKDALGRELATKGLSHTPACVTAATLIIRTGREPVCGCGANERRERAKAEGWP